jgi:ribulose-phosphate 3-epimerase
MESKIKAARNMIRKSGKHIDLEVDGGIKTSNVQRVVKAGANIIVMGTEIFHSVNYAAKIREVRKVLKS